MQPSLSRRFGAHNFPWNAQRQARRRGSSAIVWILASSLSACQGADGGTPAQQNSGSLGTTGSSEGSTASSGTVSTSTGGTSTQSAVSSTGAGGSTTTVTSSEATSTVSTVSTMSSSAGGSTSTSASTESATTGDGGSGGTISVVDPGTEGDGDYTVSPPYGGLGQGNVPQGTTYQWTMSSDDSQIYRGDDATLNSPMSFTRGIRVYVPAQYVDGTPAPVMVVQDGFQGDLQTATNNLIEEGSMPPVVLVFVDNGGGNAKGSQRGLEYDTVSDRYSRFITTEVLPAVEANQEVLSDYPEFRFTTDPEGRGAYGCSSGGAAAFTMGWFTPDQFRRIVTYSGTFTDQQDDDAAEEAEYPLGAWEYHERLIAENDPKPLRVFIHAGENDLGASDPESTHQNWLMANQRMAAALASQGYHYRFVYAEGTGHCDGSVIRSTLEDTLRWMWRGYIGGI